MDTLNVYARPVSRREGRIAGKSLEHQYHELHDVYAELQRWGNYAPFLPDLDTLKAHANERAGGAT